MFLTFRQFFKCCLRTPPCASELVLTDGDQAVANELERRLSIGRQVTQHNVASVVALCSSRGLDWGSLQAPPEVRASPWYDTLSSEQRDSLLFSLATRAQSDRTVFRDIGWSPAKVRHSTANDAQKQVATTQLPKQVNWIIDGRNVPRLQLGREAFLFQGFPTARVQQLVDVTSERLMGDIAGNMMSTTVVLATLMSMFASVSWRSDVQVSAADLTTSAGEVDEAMRAFSILAPAPPRTEGSNTQLEVRSKRRRP